MAEVRNLPRHLLLLVQQDQYVVGVHEKTPTGQTKEQHNQQTLLEDNAHLLHVLTAKILVT